MFSVECQYMNLDQIYRSGQIFRWTKVRNGKYIIPYQNKALKIEQIRNRLVLSCTDEEFYKFWFDFFDMNTEYDELNDRICCLSEFSKKCALKGSGIRIVKQDLFETIISFIISQQQSIPRIRAILDNICKVCGLKHTRGMKECGQVTWYEFPTPEKILENSEAIKTCGLGYREPYVVGICQAIADGWLDLELLKSMDYESARDYLMEFDGIGPKVADCICLYALHHLEAFPIDSHVQFIMEREFDAKTQDEMYESLDDVEDCRGLAQQYMFYNELLDSKGGLK